MANMQNGAMAQQALGHAGHENGLPPQQAQDEMERKRQQHGKISEIEAELKDLVSETYELERLAEARAWEEEAAMGEDMIVEDQREEEVRQAVKATKELLSECRYRENVLKMEKEKRAKAREQLWRWGKEIHDLESKEAERKQAEFDGELGMGEDDARGTRHGTNAGVLSGGGDRLGIHNFRVAPPRRMSSASSLLSPVMRPDGGQRQSTGWGAR